VRQPSQRAVEVVENVVVDEKAMYEYDVNAVV
jgi:hypothetical protein